MNYRRGSQRIYAVLTVAWIGVLLFALPADRLKFWLVSNDWVVVKETPDFSQYGTVTPAPLTIYSLPPGAVDLDPNAKPVATESRTQKLLWLTGVLLGPPLAGYAAIFLIVPWIYRGFRSSVI